MEPNKSTSKKDFKFQYSIDKENHILFKKYLGKLTIEDMHNSWDYVNEHKLISFDIIGFMLDFNDAHFDFKDGDKIPQYFKKKLYELEIIEKGW